MDPRFKHLTDFLDKNLKPNMTLEEKRRIALEISDLSEAELDSILDDSAARQARVPKIGSEAPDFELERIEKNRKHTGEFIRLSSLRGKPVALAFGSYT